MKFRIARFIRRLPFMKDSPSWRNKILGAFYVYMALVVIGAVLPSTPDDGVPATAEADPMTSTTIIETHDTTQAETTAKPTPTATTAQPTMISTTAVSTTVEPTTSRVTTTPQPTTISTTTKPEPTPEPTTVKPSVTPELMEYVIEDNGVHVENVDIDDADNWASLDHYSAQGTSEGLAGEMGTIGGAWAGYVKDNPNAPDELIVTVVHDGTGTIIGSYVVDTDDARAYANGEISGETFAQYIFASIVQY
jgi:hypothetical protein